jgi:hypothetical protein
MFSSAAILRPDIPRRLNFATALKSWSRVHWLHDLSIQSVHKWFMKFAASRIIRDIPPIRDQLNREIFAPVAQPDRATDF